MFNSYIKSIETIILTGNIVEKIGADIFNSSQENIFVFEGIFKGEKRGSDMAIHKVFEVKKWNLLYPIKRGYIGYYVPDNALTLYDYLKTEKINDDE